MYGNESKLPANLKINALLVACQVDGIDQLTPLQSIYPQLMHLEEQREKKIKVIEKRLVVSKRNFDKNLTLKKLIKDQYVLLWGIKTMHA